MERKTVGALGAAVAAGAGAGTLGLGNITINGASIPTNILEVGGWTLVVLETGFIVYGLFRGWIVPKPYYDSAIARAVAAEGAIDRLSDRVTKLTDTNSVQAHAIEKISAGADTTIKIMSALQDARTNAIKEGAE
jgi:hypothetical protein